MPSKSNYLNKGLDFTKQSEIHETIRANGVKIDSHNTAQTATNTKLDNLSGAPNNNLGMGASKLQVYPYGHDTVNDVMKPLKMDASGRLECSVDALEITADTINLSTNELETKVDAVTSKLDGFAGAASNNIGTGASKLQTFPYGKDSANDIMRPIKVDAIGKVIVDSPSGSDLCLRLDAIQNAVQIIDNAISGNEMQCDIVSGSVTISGGATEAKQGAGLPSALSSDNLKVSLKETIDVPVTNAGLTELASAINSDKVDVNISSGGFDGAVTNSHLTELGNAINSNKVDVNISSGGFDGAVSNAGLTELAAAINSNKMDVNLVSGGFDGAVSNAGLTELAAAINSNKMDVNLVSGGFDGAVSGTVTANLSATDNAVLDAILAKNTEIETSCDALISANHTDLLAIDGSINTIEACVGSNKLNVNISSGGFDGAISGTVTANLSATDNAVLDAILAKNTEIETSANALISANHTDLLAIDGSINTIEACVGSNKVNVNISSGGFDGAVTNAGLTELASAINSNRVDVNIANGGFDGAISGTVTANLSATDNAVLDAILAKNTEIETSANALISANHTDLVALESSLTSMEGKLADIETAVQLIDNGYGTMTETELHNATVAASGNVVSSVFTKTREIQQFAFAVVAASNGSYNAFVEASVDNTTYFQLNGGQSFNIGGNAENFQDIGTSQISAAFKYYRIRLVNNHSSGQGMVVKVCF